MEVVPPEQHSSPEAPRDREIRRLVIDRLSGSNGARVIEELGLLRGEIRVDIAMVSSVLEGFEIKSDHDSLARLPRQREVCARVFEHMTLVTSGRHLKRAKDMIPAWWGLWVVEVGGSGLHLRELRPAEANPQIDLAALVPLLWKGEAVSLLARWCDETGLRRWSREDLCQSILSRVPAEEVKSAVARSLRERRDWRTC